MVMSTGGSGAVASSVLLSGPQEIVAFNVLPGTVTF